MRCINLSLADLKRQSGEWARIIQKDYQPDLIVYVAKAGFLIGLEFSKTMNTPMIGVETIREKGNRVKNYVAPIVRRLPVFIRNILIAAELISGVHTKNNKREVRLLDNISETEKREIERILVVDDSIDTGASVFAVIEYLKEIFINVEIKLAGLNVWDKSKSVILADFALYRNTIIKAPMSKDSCEYDEFIGLFSDFLSVRKLG